MKKYRLVEGKAAWWTVKITKGIGIVAGTTLTLFGMYAWILIAYGILG